MKYQAFIDVPYEKNYDSVMYVAKQLRELKNFLQDVTGRKITEESVKKAVDKSKIASNNYYRQLHLNRSKKHVIHSQTDIT
jgi:benzoyl-CoA reductase/2-hydroxyglutaryl-CoA dehydratase subunit BcrC/BadD/HgdB